MDQVENFKVYIHMRLDKNEPFYVGVTRTKRRPYVSSARNRLWKAIVAKTDFDVIILWDGLIESDALRIERELIERFGTIYDDTGILANMTKGGDYSTKYADHRKSRDIVRESTRKLWQNEEWRDGVLKTMYKNRNTPEYKEEYSKKMKERHARGDFKPITDEGRKKLSETNTKLFNTPEWKERRSEQAKRLKFGQDPTVRVFKKVKGCIFVGTKFELQNQEGLKPGNFHFITKHSHRTWCGWRLIKNLPNLDENKNP
jgi:hypothetical protein